MNHEHTELHLNFILPSLLLKQLASACLERTVLAVPPPLYPLTPFFVGRFRPPPRPGRVFASPPAVPRRPGCVHPTAPARRAGSAPPGGAADLGRRRAEADAEAARVGGEVVRGVERRGGRKDCPGGGVVWSEESSCAWCADVCVGRCWIYLGEGVWLFLSWESFRISMQFRIQPVIED